MSKTKKKQKTIEEFLQEALVPKEEQPYEVPGNWVWTYTGIVNEVVTGSTPSKKKKEYYGAVFPFVKPADLDQERLVETASEYLSDKGRDISRIIPKFSTLICCIGSIGKTGFSTIECTTNQQINSLIPKGINVLYNYYQSLTPYFQSELWNRSSSTTVSIINKSRLSEIPFPLPPLNEQKRISDKVERLLNKIDEAKRLIEEVKETFELRRAAILDKAFRGELGTNDVNDVSMDELFGKPFKRLKAFYPIPKNWRWVELKEVFEQVKEQTEPTGIEKYIGLEHLEKGGGILKIGSSKGLKSKKLFFKRGDVLYGKLRPYLNKHAYVDFKGIASTDIIAFRNKFDNEMLSRLLDLYLGLPRVVAYANENSSGINLPRVSPKAMGQLPFPCPPVNEQRRIVEKVDKLLGNLEREKKIVEVIISELDLLKHSILSKAFRGELGTNDPLEESAVELLKEVLQEKQK